MSVGIDESLNSVSTRATVDDPDTYSGFKTGAKYRCKLSGTWTNHGSGTVTKTSTGTTAVASDNKIYTLANEVLYWDDYGTADATNESTGRANGLTIYGAAVDDGATTVAVSNWSALDCSVPQDQTSGWATKDLLISNNTKAASTYKFDNSTDPANLIFKHVTSKITVNLYKR